MELHMGTADACKGAHVTYHHWPGSKTWRYSGFYSLYLLARYLLLGIYHRNFRMTRIWDPVSCMAILVDMHEEEKYLIPMPEAEIENSPTLIFWKMERLVYFTLNLLNWRQKNSLWFLRFFITSFRMLLPIWQAIDLTTVGRIEYLARQSISFSSFFFHFSWNIIQKRKSNFLERPKLSNQTFCIIKTQKDNSPSI